VSERLKHIRPIHDHQSERTTAVTKSYSINILITHTECRKESYPSLTLFKASATC
jgi:hypothetical protein